jgi:hypothetical protein
MVPTMYLIQNSKNMGHKTSVRYKNILTLPKWLINARGLKGVHIFKERD